MRNNTIILTLVVIMAAIVIYIALPVQHPLWLENAVSTRELPRDLENLKLGLDLQGGTQVLLEADLADGQELDETAMDAAKQIVENRVNGLGVSEAVVQRQGENRLIAELPGVDDPDRAVQTIRSTGQLEFVDVSGTQLPELARQGNVFINTTERPEVATRLQERIVAGEIDPSTAFVPYPDQVFQTAMTGDVLADAQAAQNQFNQWIIVFNATSDGAQVFGNYTGANIGQPMGIVLDGLVLSAPTIQARISDQGEITGDFTREEAESLAVQMRYGALPVPLQVVDVRTIGASLGQDSVSRSLTAGIIGIIGVLLFMLALYRLPGLLANIALIIYIALNVAVFKLMPVTLTLAGIAGFILSIGMAVDANILIFERMKEELRTGRSTRLAVEAGFSRAWPAIRDGNLSTLISCAVLFWFGNQFGASIVKGFAITLGIGVVLSMFTAVFVTRTFMRAFLVSRTGRLDSNARALIGY